MWWTLHASAPLQTVAAQNYTCFGRGGVPRHDVVSAESADRDPATLCVELIVHAPDGSTRFANLDLTLAPREKDSQHVTWTGYDAAQHLQTIWVWDFYRLLSHVVLRVADSPADSPPDAAWQAALDGIRALSTGDTLVLNVRSACGDIRQQHVLTSPAIAWQPV